jgi:hypothetical protein
MAGLPDAPRSFVPQPVMGKTAAELAAYVERQRSDHRPSGDAGSSMALTTALDGASCRPRSNADRDADRRADTEDNLQRTVPPQQLDRQAADRAADA